MKTLFTLRGMRSQANEVAARVLPEPVGPGHVRKFSTEILHRSCAQIVSPPGLAQTPPVNSGGASLNESYLWRQDRGSIRYCYLSHDWHPQCNFFAMQSSQPTTLELNDFHLRRLSDADPRAELFDAGLAPIRWDVPPAFVWMTQGLIDWRPEGSPVIVRRSPAEQLLRGAQGSDRPAWSDNRGESCQDELARPHADAGHVGDAGIRAIGRGGASREAEFESVRRGGKFLGGLGEPPGGGPPDRMAN
jgi:hypothetical protein